MANRASPSGARYRSVHLSPVCVTDDGILPVSQNITHLQLTPTRVFALSASGRIYVLSSRQADQALPSGAQTPASTPWWGTGWLWGEEEEVDFAEITPKEKLKRGEK